MTAKAETHTAEAVQQLSSLSSDVAKATAKAETHTAATVQQLSSLSSDVATATAKAEAHTAKAVQQLSDKLGQADACNADAVAKLSAKLGRVETRISAKLEKHRAGDTAEAVQQLTERPSTKVQTHNAQAFQGLSAKTGVPLRRIRPEATAVQQPRQLKAKRRPDDLCTKVRAGLFLLDNATVLDWPTPPQQQSMEEREFSYLKNCLCTGLCNFAEGNL